MQLVGTVDAAALEAALRRTSDSSWRPLRISGDPRRQAPQAEATAPDGGGGLAGDVGRAMLSVGVGDFRNTSSGPYFELALAFPACQVPAEEEALVLPCSSFITCQDQLPDCSHTYMFKSWANHVQAVQHIREGGINAELASDFRYRRREATVDSGGSVEFSVLAPDGTEVLEGAVETAPPSSADQDTAGAGSAFSMGRGPGYRMQLFVGSPGVLEAKPSQGKHICAFPNDLDMSPTRIAEPLRAGALLTKELDFKIEGAFYLSNLRVVRLPPWGHRGEGDQSTVPKETRVGAQSSATRAPQSGQSASSSPTAFQDAGWEEGSRAPWANAPADTSHRNSAGAVSGEGSASSNFPWHLHDNDRVASVPPAGPRPVPQSVASSSKDAQGDGVAPRTVPSSEGGVKDPGDRDSAFPWHLHEI